MWLRGFWGAKAATASESRVCWGGVLMAAGTTSRGWRRGGEVCTAGLGLWGSGVHTRGKGGRSWRRRSPKEEEARAAHTALGGLQKVSPTCADAPGLPLLVVPGLEAVQTVCSLSCPSDHWAQDLREGGASEKDSRLLLWPQEVVAGRGTLAEGAGV